MAQSKLMGKRYWDHLWKSYSNHSTSLSKKNIKKIFGHGFLAKDRNRSFWAICKKYLPKSKSKTIFEIGCAPGDLLVEFKDKFGYSIFGMDYSKYGYEATKSNFFNANIPIENLVLDDFTSEKFQKKFKKKFDIVYSRGFIEHFNDAKKIVELHSNLVKKDGIVLITIPNFSWFNGKILAFFNKELLSGHNTNIMTAEALGRITAGGVKILYCNYLGHFDFFMFSATSRWKKTLLTILQLFQLLLEKTFWKIYKPVHTGKYSSNLILIARKI